MMDDVPSTAHKVLLDMIVLYFGYVLLIFFNEVPSTVVVVILDTIVLCFGYVLLYFFDLFLQPQEAVGQPDEKRRLWWYNSKFSIALIAGNT